MINDLWYKNAVIYCLSVGTNMDSNGDGAGDFRGLMRRLDYLHGLGVTAIWLMPFQTSPCRDDGYDVADYYNVDPRYGTLGDFVEFTHAAKQHGIRGDAEIHEAGHFINTYCEQLIDDARAFRRSAHQSIVFEVELEGGVHNGVAVGLSDVISSDAHVVILFEIRAQVMCERRAYLLFDNAITLSDKRVHHDGNDACLRIVTATRTPTEATRSPLLGATNTSETPFVSPVTRSTNLRANSGFFACFRTAIGLCGERFRRLHRQRTG